jgi:hypothetical protein
MDMLSKRRKTVLAATFAIGTLIAGPASAAYIINYFDANGNLVGSYGYCNNGTLVGGSGQMTNNYTITYDYIVPC